MVETKCLKIVGTIVKKIIEN